MSKTLILDSDTDERAAHVLHQDLETYLTRRLPIEKDSLTENHLLQCKPCVARLTDWADFAETLGKLTTLLPDGSEEKRRHPRVVVHDSGVFQVLNPFLVETSVIQVSNISKHGMRLKVPKRVERGSFVKVRVKKALFFGEIRYCEAASDGSFHVGVHLQDFVSVPPFASSSK